MNKTEFKRVARKLLNERFEMFSNVKVLELNCERSTIDDKLFINYLVIINNVQVYKVHISEDEFCGSTDIFCKESLMKECLEFTGLFDVETCRQVY